MRFIQSYPTRAIVVSVLCPAFLAALAILIGCQVVPVAQSRFNKDFTPPPSDTFCFGTLPAMVQGIELETLDQVRRELVETATAVLQEKGFHLCEREEADLIVHILYNSIQKVDISNIGYSRSRDRNWDMQYPVNELSLTVNAFEEGQLVVEIRSASEDEWIWSGWGTSMNSASQFTSRRMKPMMREILAGFSLD